MTTQNEVLTITTSESLITRIAATLRRAVALLIARRQSERSFDEYTN